MSEHCASQIDKLIEADRVHRDVYTAPGIFDLEMARIFGRSWIWIGHASQVASIGDFVTTRIGRQPVIMVRHGDGQIKVLINRCRHRGVRLCALDRGNTKQFRCPYHGWTYRTDGTLLTEPLRDVFAKDFDLDEERMGLTKVARVDSYRGFVFANLTPGGADLMPNLGPMKAGIDDICDRAPEGEIAFTGGGFKQQFDANWKFWVENMIDLDHPRFAHVAASSAARGMEPGSDYVTARAANRVLNAFGASSEFWNKTGVWANGDGHGYMGSLAPGAEPDGDIYLRYKAALEEKHGPERAQEILNVSRHNNLLYPNFNFQTSFQHVKIVDPITVDHSEVRIFAFQMKGAPEEMNRDAIVYLNTVQSPASIIQSDDFDIYERQQQGLTAQGSDWVYFARGAEGDVAEDDGGFRAVGTSELPMRKQFQAWRALMTE
ncbi:MAG: Rieske 2Fe-2S domain-containing protein [Rhodospirillaceae bacterium]|jgi:phenylpropionate dioxygenase-like ring-hydroxylating dioxygenase large terminal subunit|nr:Rieske 2Fe-2S domain-containing protein [Rhodospirillaceae bacterium]MBT3884080.1 Rieske 2Fe-2S domain-containing protein [Rhodospirillaceae bacterium]MBT4119174.1 Rieske 2Fe-2S domain-containing protein [Rhodospirillaceae bacterium]MBT4673270.1 Rieske 2Fe-2S domain-containing protein [Rhodospirillaceae bacterium]MBT4719658.1 Rieske 2Fe-2S domain-containing protein [Rhodospirillaceae bacterium]